MTMLLVCNISSSVGHVHGGANMYQIAVLISLVIEDSMIQNGTGLGVDIVANWSSIGTRWWIVELSHG